MLPRAAVAGAFVWSVAVPGLAQQPAPIGNEFKVNSYTSRGEYAAVSGDGNGTFVVVWQGASIPCCADPATDVFGQRYDTSGNPLGGEFQVNTYTTHRQEHPAVAMGPSGEFVIAWTSFIPTPTGVFTHIFARRYDSSGSPLGPEFRVTEATRGGQISPSVAMDGAGNFVVVWEGATQFRAYAGISARVFDASGTPRGSEFPVGVDVVGGTTGHSAATVAMRPDSGDFVVAWHKFAFTDRDLLARRFDAMGQPLAPPFVVSSWTTHVLSSTSLGIDASGRFVVVWEKGQDVLARRFDASGDPTTSEFRINTYTAGRQGAPSVSVSAAGDFVGAWESEGQDGSDLGVFGQAFDSGGTPVGAEFQVNAYTTGRQHFPAIAAGPPGSFLVTWSGNDHSLGDAPGDSILARRFGPDIIFADGFESGDLSAWSSAQTDGADLTVSGSAAMAGTAYGLQAAVDDRTGLFVQDDSPSGESRYRARFYLDPSGFDPGEANGRFRTRVFLAFAGAPLKRLVQVVLRRQAGAYSLAAHVRRDDDTLADIAFSAISAAPHVVELDWRRSSAPGADDGGLELWIDGTSVGALSGLDNDARGVDFVRLGALSVKDGASGTLWFDEFESRRSTYIGPP